MAVSVKFELDSLGLQQLLHGRDGAVGRELLRRAYRVETRAKQLAPVDTGRLRASITVEMITRGDLPVAIVGTNVYYARYVHDGTGLYGPHATRITPKHGRYLVFTPKGSKDVVFARSVKGTHGRPFLRDALPAALG